VFVTVAAAASLKALTEGRRNRWLEGTFGKYLSPSVIEALKRDPSLIQLGGRRVEVSVLFSDVRGFTGISERLRPDDLVRLLNRYLTRQSAETLGEDGVIDKFFGDGVMAFFGDPIPHADHAKRACRAAVRSSRATADLESLTRELGVPEIVNRIGVNSGPALVGNMGSEARFDYTAMGDTVNLASRLESANKFFGSRILVGEATWDLAKDILVGKPIGRLVVMGRAEPVGVHEVVGLAGEAPEDLVRHARAFAEAHDAARSDDLETARARLAEAERLRPGDGPCAWLGRLLDDLEAGRRPRPWDGVVVLDAK
jgi:adenylate cyclase